MSPTDYKRQMRHFLIDKKFQLKYTLIIVLISSVISVVLGFFIFRAHVDIRQAHRKIYEANRESSELVALGSLDPEIKEVLSKALKKEDELVRAKYEVSQTDDRKVLFYLVSFLGLLVLSLSVVGIVATHKIAGPAYNLCRVLHEITEGRLPKGIRLRRGDELKNVAEELGHMVNTLRKSEMQDIQFINAFITALKNGEHVAKQTDEVIAGLEKMILEKENKLKAEIIKT